MRARRTPSPIRTPRSLLGRYLLYYSILLAAPLLTMGLVTNWLYSRSFVERALADQQSRLARIREVADARMDELRDISCRLAGTAALLPIPGVRGPQAGRKIIAELQKYASTNGVVRDILVSFDGDPLVYTTEGSRTSETLSRTFYRSGPVVEELSTLAHRISGPAILPAATVDAFPEGRREILVHLSPLPVDTTYAPYGFVAILVDTGALRRLLVSEDPQTAENLEILGADGTRIVSYGEPAFLDRARPERDHLRIALPSADGARLYVSWVPRQKIAHSLAPIRNTFLGATVLIVVAGAILIFVFTFASYRPIRGLLRHVSLRAGTREPRLGEIDYLWSSFDRAFDESSHLAERMKEHAPALREHVVFRMLRGSTMDVEGLRRSAREAGLELTGPTWLAMALHVAGPASADALQGAVPLLESCTPAFCEVMGRPGFGDNRLILVVDGSLDAAGARALAERYQRTITERWGATCTIGLGRTCDDIRGLPASYVEAASALDYRIVRGNGTVIACDDVQERDAGSPGIPREAVQTVRRAVLDRDPERLASAMDILVRRVRRERAGLMHAKVLFAVVLDAVVSALYEIGGELRLADGMPDVFSIVRLETLEELADALGRLSRSAVEVMDTSKRLSGLSRDVVQYVESAYADPNLSVSGMAERFGLSHTSLNARFKREVGQTLWHYVNAVRMAKAKDLLLTTELPLKEIVHVVGYQDDSNFIRKFRLAERVTPGEYRRLHNAPETTRRERIDG